MNGGEDLAASDEFGPEVSGSDWLTLCSGLGADDSDTTGSVDFSKDVRESCGCGSALL